MDSPKLPFQKPFYPSKLMNIRHFNIPITLFFWCFLASTALTQPIAPPASYKPAANGSIELANKNINIGGSVTSPYRYGNKMYFTATVPAKSGKGSVSRIFSSVGDAPAQLSAINPKEDQLHAAQATLSTSTNRIYYTIFRETSPGKVGQCEIWYRDNNFDGTWGKAEKLPPHINKPNTTNYQPCLGYDFQAKKEVLYFASNREGGKGGFDIWQCIVEPNGSFGNVENLPFNTAMDEVSPYFFTPQQILFFSANDAGGLGGFDIFQIEKKPTGEWGRRTSVPQVNSRFDDLYFSYHPPSQTSYFSSNRPNSLCKDSLNACEKFIVYSGNLGGNLILSILNLTDSTALYGCNIELEDASTGIIEKTIAKSESNTLHMPLYPGKKYRIIVSRQGFYPAFIELETAGGSSFQAINQNVMLKPMR